MAGPPGTDTRFPVKSPRADLCVAALEQLKDVDFSNLEKLRGKGLVSDYKKFLALKAGNEDFYAAILSPSSRIDEIWHMHILDTLAYKETCEAMLGYGGFIHHNPYGGKDLAARNKRLARTIKLFRETFGEPETEWYPRPQLPVTPPSRPQLPAASDGASGGGSLPPPDVIPPSRPKRRLQNEITNAPPLKKTSPSPWLSGTRQIFVKNQGGKIISLSVKKSTTIENVKRQIEHREGIPPEDQRLLYKGYQLDGDYAAAKNTDRRRFGVREIGVDDVDEKHQAV